MIVECFGLPGAGKSTLVENLSKEDRFVVPPQYVSKRYSFASMLKHPLFFLRYMIALLGESMHKGSFGLTRFKLAVFMNTMGRLEYARKNYSTDDIVLLDEGVLQRLLSLSERENKKEMYGHLIQKSTLADVIICVTSETIDVTNVKIGERRNMMSEPRIQKWRTALMCNYIEIKKAAKAGGVEFYEHHRNSDVVELIGYLNKSMKL